MISDLEPLATLPVKDMGPARQFYEGVLGLSSKMEGPDGSVVYGAGSGAVMVYPSTFAGTNKATAVSFQVPMDGFDAEVSALRGKGVSFQTFEADELDVGRRGRHLRGRLPQRVVRGPRRQHPQRRGGFVQLSRAASPGFVAGTLGR